MKMTLTTELAALFAVVSCLLLVAAVGIVVYVGRRYVLRCEELKDEAQHFAEQAYEHWYEMCIGGAGSTEQLPRVTTHLGAALTIEDQMPNANLGRHLRKPPLRFNGELLE